jgi:integrase
VNRSVLKRDERKRIKLPKNMKPEPVVPYTPAEVEKMIGAATLIGKTEYERLRARAMVLLLQHTALCISDIALMERSRIDGNVILLHTQNRSDDPATDSRRTASCTRGRAHAEGRGPEDVDALLHKRRRFGAHNDQRGGALPPVSIRNRA